MPNSFKLTNGGIINSKNVSNNSKITNILSEVKLIMKYIENQ